MVNVTKSNFVEASRDSILLFKTSCTCVLTLPINHIACLKESNDFIRRLPTAAFVAIDEEMTGIVIPSSPRPPKDQTPNERYETLKAVPE